MFGLLCVGFGLDAWLPSGFLIWLTGAYGLLCLRVVFADFLGVWVFSFGFAQHEIPGVGFLT